MTHPGSGAVPPVDSALNQTSAQVIGNKGDGHDGDSLVAMGHTLEEHVHKPSLILPNLAGMVNVVAGGVAWTYGAIVSLGTPTDDYDVHRLYVDPNDNAEYQICLVANAAEIGCTRIKRNNVFVATEELYIQTPIIAGNTELFVKIASSVVGADLDICVMYHTY